MSKSFDKFRMFFQFFPSADRNIPWIKNKTNHKTCRSSSRKFSYFCRNFTSFFEIYSKSFEKKIFFRYFTDLWVKIAVVFSKIYRRFEMNQTTKRVEALRGNFQIMAVIYHLFSKSTQRSLSKKCKTCRRASIN